MEFDDTLTEADFRRPLLEPSEERLLAMLRNEPDLAVDGLEHSLVSRLLTLFGGKRA
jgi:hypothetical protein